MEEPLALARLLLWWSLAIETEADSIRMKEIDLTETETSRMAMAKVHWQMEKHAPAQGKGCRVSVVYTLGIFSFLPL
jgi:hypothetical protein